MSIMTMRRVTLAGLAADKDAVLEQLQQLGCMHLVELGAHPREPERTPSPHALEARKALRHLREVPDKRRQVREPTDFDLAATITQVLDNQQRLRDISDRRDALRQRLAELEPWGEFSLPEPAALAGRKLWFYILPLRQLDALARLELPWQIVHRDHRQAWVVVIAEREPPADALPVARTHTGAFSRSEVARRLERAEIELEAVIAERHALTRWIYLLSSHLAEAEDQAGLNYARAQTYDDEALFLVQGWVALEDCPGVQALADQLGLALLLEAPGADDQPPTRLDNPAPVAAGQDLVGFYQMPAYRSWDPSRVLFFSFTLFFAMILSDAGYALVLGAALALGWRRLGRSETGGRLRLLALALCGGALLWGILVGSYFGVTPAPDGLLGQLRVFDLDDFATMMWLSVAIGVLHLVLANVERALSSAPGAERRIALAWIAALLGGFALWSGTGPSGPLWLATLGQWLLGGGLIALFTLGSDRPIRSPTSALLRVLDGLRQLVRVTQAFGDVLSYLRLFALGLASASLALTFNELARDVQQGQPGLGLLLSILILLVGHVLNLALCLMSGVVHGLRLNFIEFYNWALAGEGYPFKPFKKTELSE
ncbi:MULTISPECIES: V-type ATP synthase subunit I [Marichromatium]|uniref:V/A-type H+-transporting ATPase subunit I n=1 Tax=Marichromatium gracile TaxID=1048 RepID=A0A4V2W942_MARGR|nr:MULTISPECIES: V-type ATPase 116kDa subunit family protein [Marichromatium]MBK1708100.1 V-type ATP synthase subunit I [Marichromatium gracile]MBO8086370.1 V-type ATP synthase subunit I [Marichromatium sp.]RNE94741.1 V-type ATP synthase subunit I [Marichromatium sp. AB32]TCW33397.1 V/A-type H+-transporting ATPase subunit I [Marichromatium gracile]